jgi:hypothetical protein
LWLFELHRLLWNRPQLEEEIFRTATLTPGHWTKLQQKLDTRYPGRHSDSYHAKDDVSPIKLDLLGELSTSVSLGSGLTSAAALPETVNAAIADQSDDLDEDDSTSRTDTEVSLFLPATIKYLDLSELPRSSHPTRCNFPILIRDEYDQMELLLEGFEGSGGSVFVTGQLGIGMRPRFLTSLLPLNVFFCFFLSPSITQ